MRNFQFAFLELPDLVIQSYERKRSMTIRRLIIVSGIVAAAVIATAIAYSCGPNANSGPCATKYDSLSIIMENGSVMAPNIALDTITRIIINDYSVQVLPVHEFSSRPLNMIHKIVFTKAAAAQ
jgi:hypothetical protein